MTISNLSQLPFLSLGCNRTFDEPYGRITSPGWPRSSPPDRLIEIE